MSRVFKISKRLKIILHLILLFEIINNSLIDFVGSAFKINVTFEAFLMNFAVDFFSFNRI